MQKPLIVSVGAGPGQTLFIEKLKEAGYAVAAFGKGKNDPKAIALCDYFCEIDTSDDNAAISWLQSLPVQPSAAGSYAGGKSILTLQKIIKHFDLPGEIPDEFLIGMDKFDQQKIYEKYGLSSIKTYANTDLSPEILADSQKYIVKPSIGRGSSGVRIVSGQEIKQNLEQYQKEDHTIIQELCSGTEYRTLIYIQDAEIKILVPILRISYPDSFLLGRLSYEETDLPRIYDYVTQLIKNTDIRNSVIKADIICTQDSVNLIEMDIGVGGGIYFKEYISRLLEEELIHLYIDFITDHKIQKKPIVNPSLIMDYIYNWKQKPISYQPEETIQKIQQKLGDCKLQINRLHPEQSGQAATNADFVFTVIHSDTGMELQELNQWINQECFREVSNERD